MPEQPAAGSCAWGDAATIIPWTMYLFYGDKEMLRRQYANMKLWTDYIYRIDEENVVAAGSGTTGSISLTGWLLITFIRAHVLAAQISTL